MHTVNTVAGVRERVRAWRAAGEPVALVPTMGNLHAGHIALVARARALAARVVVSVFVNPLQFGPNEDLAAYPRTPDQDAEKLREAGADLLFMPSVDEMYPHGNAGVTQVEVPGLSDILCGASRPGHFRGVATVVSKLFNIVQPDVAVFGEKDYQQLAVIRRLVEDLCFPIRIEGVPTARESDGLARSSRNCYLSAEARARAPGLYRALVEIAEAIRAGRRDFSALEQQAAHALAQQGFHPDYVSIRRAADLTEPGDADTSLAVLAAARLGTTRLIDNLLIGLD
ncbi:MAG: pantoate--beta-alanine ligase [Gammaproteobacteria bacterium]|nr:pantoate--beta-alanine ligase [Gammaproteobacteria bacterium]